MRAYVHDYDELLDGHPDETWEWLEMKGRACFEQARKRGNSAQSQYGLTGRPSQQAIVDLAVLGEPYVLPVRKAKGRAQSPDGNWPHAGQAEYIVGSIRIRRRKCSLDGRQTNT
jgi:hypothetical protein